MHLRAYICFIQVIIIYCVLTVGHDLYLGTDFGARMSYIEVKKHGLIFFKRQKTEELMYPEGTNITGIACQDLSPGKTGSVAIVDGGLYYNHVKFNLESGAGDGLKYIIEIYTSASKYLHPETVNVVQITKL